MVSFSTSAGGYATNNQHENRSLGLATEFSCNCQWSGSVAGLFPVQQLNFETLLLCEASCASPELALDGPGGGGGAGLTSFGLGRTRSWVCAG